MSANLHFQRMAAWTTIIAGLLQIAVIVTGSAGVRDFSTAMTDPGAISNFSSPNLLRWSMIFDMLGWYLMMTPLVLVLRNWLQPKSPNLVLLSTVCGLFYILIGAIGAALLSVAAPYLISEYAQATAARREILDIVFRALWNGVQTGLWITLEPIPAGIWLVITGLLLRSERRVLGLSTLVLGVLALLNPPGIILGINALDPRWPGTFWGLLTPLWVLWFGIDLLRKPGVPGEETTPTTA